MQYKIHQIAEIFPRMSGEEFVSLKRDIQERGLLEPIWLYEGCVLDGRHRYYACQETGSEPLYREYEGDDPVGFVVSLNLKRRHLNESQRAMVAAKLANMPAHRPPGNSANLHTSQAQAAEMLQVSPRSVASAAKVQSGAAVELVDAVMRGDVSVSAAAGVSHLPKEVQADIVATGPQEVVEVAKQQRCHVANNSGENEWYTPAKYIQLAREAMGTIDLDPASCELANQTVAADMYFTAQQNGLARDWRGNVWLNPPYAQPLIAQFAEKVINELQRIEQACVLVNNATDTAWMQLLLKHCDAACFIRGRVKFIDKEGNPSGAPLQGQVILYYGGSETVFAEKFSEVGPVLVHYQLKEAA